MRYRVKHIEIGNFRSFFALLLPPPHPKKNPKIKILKNEKNCLRYHHFTHVYQKSQSFDVQILKYGVRQAEFFVILGHFLPFEPPNPKNQNFEKLEKTPGDIIISYMCTINDNQMMCYS